MEQLGFAVVVLGVTQGRSRPWISSFVRQDGELSSVLFISFFIDAFFRIFNQQRIAANNETVETIPHSLWYKLGFYDVKFFGITSVFQYADSCSNVIRMAIERYILICLYFKNTVIVNIDRRKRVKAIRKNIRLAY